MLKHYNSFLKVSPQFVGALIGKGGSNIKRIIKNTGNSAYIKAFNTESPGKSLPIKARHSTGPANAFYIESNCPTTIKR